jgi:5-formaminoimidazole-4-carboxamide-1-(beta)-D-ribofuranosyl 5'-monophosphate synthetase
MGGSPYSDLIEPGLSNGRRIAKEIKSANERDLLHEIIS